MRLPTVSTPAVVAVGLLVVVVSAVALSSVGGSTPEASAHDGEPSEAGGDGGQQVDGLSGSDGVIEATERLGLADSETASLGGIGPSDDRPVAGATAATRPVVAGECPVMTDSVRRLYLAYLEREPTPLELERDIDQYRSGQANLENLSAVLAAGGLFRTLYGPLADEAFVLQIYDNTVARAPRADVLAHWVDILDDGYPRGSMVLALSESAEFVRRTATSRPLSGYLAWYPEGVHWYCGVGPRNDLPIRPLVDGDLYADYLFSNAGGPETPTGLATLLDGRVRVTMSDGSLPAGFTDYRWDGRFAGADDYGEAIDVIAGERTSWVVAFYPRSIGDRRLGWQLTR